AFVAGFIGNPPMNLFPTRLSIEDGRVRMRLGGSTLPVAPADGPDARLRAAVGVPLTAGVRPEALHLAEPGDGRVPATVEHLEALGYETLAHVRVAGADGDVALVAREPGMGRWQKGDTVGLRFDPADLHLFGADGASLTR